MPSVKAASWSKLSQGAGAHVWPRAADNGAHSALLNPIMTDCVQQTNLRHNHKQGARIDKLFGADPRRKAAAAAANLDILRH